MTKNWVFLAKRLIKAHGVGFPLVVVDVGVGVGVGGGGGGGGGMALKKNEPWTYLLIVFVCEEEKHDHGRPSRRTGRRLWVPTRRSARPLASLRRVERHRKERLGSSCD